LGRRRRQKNWSRGGIDRTADPLEHAMELIAARSRDDVIDVAGSPAKFRSEAVANRLDLTDVNGGDREEAKSVAIALRIGHSIHLIIDSVHKAIGVQRARDAQLWIGVPADAGDRKSTRLNSSHVAISYAVFCLKKKRL